MSASVDQRMKGQANQVSNGPKDNVNDEDFDAWRQQPHQSYTSTPNSSMADPYMSSYYHSVSFPYLNQGLGEGAWSNGDPVTFLGSYGEQQYMSEGIFGQSGFGYSQPGFNYFPGNGDYSTWGSTGRKTNHSYHEDYYREVSRMDYDVKGVEQSVTGLTLADKTDISKDGKTITPTDLKSSPSGDSSSSNSAPKKMSWASVASQPAKPQPKLKSKAMPPAPLLQNKQNMDIGTWDNKNNLVSKPGTIQPTRPAWGAPRGRGGGTNTYNSPTQSSVQPTANCVQSINYPTHPVLEKLRSTNEYNPKDFNLNPKGTRFFIIKSYSEDDIHRSIKYSIWCSTEHGNKRLDAAFKEREAKGPLFLFFSVNGSGHFCGMAQMMSEVDYSASSGVWAQDKWKGQFKVKWIYVKDVPNRELRHIRLENNENKPVTNSRDTQEVPCEKGKQVLKIMHSYRHTTSIFDDFIHYEKRQEEDDQRKVGGPQEEKRRLNDC